MFWVRDFLAVLGFCGFRYVLDHFLDVRKKVGGSGCAWGFGVVWLILAG